MFSCCCVCPPHRGGYGRTRADPAQRSRGKGRVKAQTRDGQTILSGEVKDQPHLFGILERLNSLGLELLRVEALAEDAEEIESRSHEQGSLL
jgi:hypothetical protein